MSGVVCSASAIVGSCNDGDACTFGDVCQDGTCEGTPYDCDDGHPCTTESCSGDGTCDVEVADGSCLISEVCYVDGALNPLNACETCASSTANEQFTTLGDGAPCDDASGCTENDTCTAGECQGEGFQCDDELACTLNKCVVQVEGSECDFSTLAPNTCLIAGACYSEGQLAADNDCLICDPSAATVGWTNKANGAVCVDGVKCTLNDSCQDGTCGGMLADCDDGNECTYDSCDDAAPAGDGCVHSVLSGNPCAADGLECTLDLCASGGCIHPIADGTCLVGGQCVAEQTLSPQSECQACQPALSTVEYTDRPQGSACSDDGISCTDDECNGSGACQHVLAAGTCIIGNLCYAEDSLNPANACESCQIFVTTTAWTALSEGTACVDDGLACTTDVCGAAATCTHDLAAGKCLIGGTCYDDLDTDPANECKVCNALQSPGQFINQGFGTFCTDDGVPCTVDHCDGGGVCVHANSSPGTACDQDALSCTTQVCDGFGGCQQTTNVGTCLIDGECFGANEPDPGNPCTQCDPNTSQAGWTELPDESDCGVCCLCDDGAPTLDGGQAAADCGGCGTCGAIDVCQAAPKGADSPACSTHLCDGASTDCPTTCTGPGDCKPGFTCDGNCN